MSDLSQIVKAYDVRGTVPDQWDERVAEALGAAFTQLLNSTDEPGDAVVVGHDMRATSPGLAARVRRRRTRRGALGDRDRPRLHRPALLRLRLARPARRDVHRQPQPGAVQRHQDVPRRRPPDRPGQRPGRDPASGPRPCWTRATLVPPVRRPGRAERRDLLPDYAGYLRKLVDLSRHPAAEGGRRRRQRHGRPHRPDRAGRRGLPALPLEIVPLYFELDGTLPQPRGQPARPGEPGRPAARGRSSTGADIGLAFDGDADRCFVVDERGEPVSPSAITALVAVRELAKHPGATVIHNLITSRAVPEIIREHGGQPVRTRVGHSFIKAEMARTDAVFGGEHSAHYYFRDFWFADTGMLAAMHVLAALGEQARPLSELAGEYERYVASGEINSTVADQAAAVAEVRAAYPDADRPTSWTGSPLRFADGAWFNLRASNTEPLLRLNVEAPDPERMARSATRCSPRSPIRSPAPVAPPSVNRHVEGAVPWPSIRSCSRSSPARTRTTPRSTYDAEAQTLICTECGRIFEVRDDIPVLLLDEARGGPGQSA